MKPKQIEYIFLAKNLIIGISLLIAAAFPLGSMGGVDTDSIYSIIVDMFKNPSETDYMFYASWFSVAIIVLALYHLLFLDRSVHYKVKGTITVAIAYAIFGTALAIGIARISDIYGITSAPIFPMIITFAAIDIVSAIIEYFIFRNIAPSIDEKETSDTPQTSEESADNKETSDTLQITKETIDETETTETPENPQNALEKEPKKKNRDKYKFDIVEHILVACLLIFALIYDMHYQGDEFIGTGYSAVCELEVGEVFSGVVDFDDNYLENVENGVKHTFTYKSCAYVYRKKKTDELINDKKRQIRELMPESASEDNFKIYASEINKLQTEIKDITTNFNSFIHTDIKVTVVGSISYPDAFSTTGYGTVIEVAYNTQCNGKTNGIKWNNTENKHLFGKQSIELSKTEFAEGTDFSAEKISATIHYYDGSFKKSYVTPLNYTELNASAKGEHIIKWTDNWGSYEYKINIV